MSELIYAVYPSALERGISQEVFWSSSVPDILDLMAAINTEEERRQKEEIQLRFIQAEAVASRIGYLFTDKKKRKASDILQPWDVYPSLFAEEVKVIKDREEKAALEAHKQQMEAYAARWNAYRKGKEDG